jgi:hypothetical protein
MPFALYLVRLRAFVQLFFLKTVDVSLASCLAAWMAVSIKW